jgi:hypothetical protein
MQPSQGGFRTITHSPAFQTGLHRDILSGPPRVGGLTDDVPGGVSSGSQCHGPNGVGVAEMAVSGSASFGATPLGECRPWCASRSAWHERGSLLAPFISAPCRARFPVSRHAGHHSGIWFRRSRRMRDRSFVWGCADIPCAWRRFTSVVLGSSAATRDVRQTSTLTRPEQPRGTASRLPVTSAKPSQS